MAHKLEVLRRHCDDVGTDYNAIEKTVIAIGDLVGCLEDVMREMEAYAALGATLVTTGPRAPREDPVAWTTTAVEQVVPRLADI